jgi:hypothetical protein
MIIVRIEDIMENLKFRSRVNRQPLDEITFTRGGKPVEIDKAAIDHWTLTGLNNIDFISTKAYIRTSKDREEET